MINNKFLINYALRVKYNFLIIKMDQGGTIDSGNKDKLPKFDKLNSLVMEPIPEKYQTRQTNQVYDTS